MYFFLIVFLFKITPTHAMESSETPEERFLKYVLNVTKHKVVTDQNVYDTILQRYMKDHLWVSSFYTQTEIEKEIEELQQQKEIEELQQQTETYRQFTRWREQWPAALKLRDLKFLFGKMAEENSVEGMQVIEALILKWNLIASPDEKWKKLEYQSALIHAATQGMADSVEYLLNKKNICLKNNSSLIVEVCRGTWGKSKYHGFKETQQKHIVQLMLKKGAPSHIDDICIYLKTAQDTQAPDRLIKYLTEVATSKKSKNNTHHEKANPLLEK